MKTSATVLAVLASLPYLGRAQSVVGKAQGFAEGVTGGGDATPEYPTTIEELVEMLTDSNPRVVVLNKEFDFRGSEGTTTGNVCASWGLGDSCQKIIQDDCGDSPALTMTWDNAGPNPINIASDKTLIGEGSSGIIRGKGLRMTNDVSNIIIQNIEVADLNHELVWGGDAIGFDGADLVWVDHVTTSRPGRQHYVFGFNPSTRVTLSNNFINGDSTYSTGCDGYHYWTFEMVGEDDQITMQGNYIYKTAGRGPALSGGTLLHAVNNVWDDTNGHALEGGDSRARGIFEGNVFADVKNIESDYQGRLFGSTDDSVSSECESALNRACEVNSLEGSTTEEFQYTDTSFFGDFAGLPIAPAVSASQALSDIPANAGAGKLSISADDSADDSADTSDDSGSTDDNGNGDDASSGDESSSDDASSGSDNTGTNCH